MTPGAGRARTEGMEELLGGVLELLAALAVRAWDGIASAVKETLRDPDAGRVIKPRR